MQNIAVNSILQIWAGVGYYDYYYYYYRIIIIIIIMLNIVRFLVYLLVSNREWSSIREIFLQEAFTRQVSWWVREASELLLLEDTDVCLYRLVATFAASKKALRIIMFQVYI